MTAQHSIFTAYLQPPHSAALLRWYDGHKRTLPWRYEGKGLPDPYRVWLAEIMLQQTVVATAIPYYQKFLARWPDIQALAAASRDDILAAWAGLGYYRRAHNLHLCAQEIVRDYGGVFPRTLHQLRALSGIGEYTAAAIISIAFDQPAIVVDGNVERIVARVFRLPIPIAQAKASIRRAAAMLMPTTRHGDYAQALMDLGAMVCRPKNPACPACPWQRGCMAWQSGHVDGFPVAAKRLAKPRRYALAFWLENEHGAVWLRTRANHGLLAGMVEVPTSPWLAQLTPPHIPDLLHHAPQQLEWAMLPTQIRHIFTHFELYIDIVYASSSQATGDGFWANQEQIKHLALPSVMRKIIAAMAARDAA